MLSRVGCHRRLTCISWPVRKTPKVDRATALGRGEADPATLHGSLRGARPARSLHRHGTNGATSDSPSRPGLVTRGKPATVAAALSRASGIAFEDQGDQDYGYRVFRARLAGKGPSWAWLTANRVRRGFVRKNDEDDAKLGKLLPELVDRYPAHQDCGFLLSSTDPESKPALRLLKSLSKLPVPVRPVRLDEE